MSKLSRIVLVLVLLSALAPAGAAQDRTFPGRTIATRRETTRVAPPELRREFRGVWLATVANIDWPSRRTLTTDEQKAELIRLLDKARELRLNAIVLQVRPQCDALYASTLEPWSEYLTGQQGRAPAPFYDPLAFAVAEAHARGMELHAWLNPYRASHLSAQSAPAPDHITMRRPDLTRTYGRYKWLDPGEPEVQDFVVDVVLDVVRRYDIDGIHFDDYFYPYAERDANNQVIPFPDDVLYQRYASGGGTLGRADWRRDNVNRVIQRLYQAIRNAKPHVKFGVSPFGIWRPGNPAGIVGLDAYNEIFADSRRWLNEGWVDYLTPQLYWPIAPPAQSYTALLDWWNSQNTRGRHLWPGNAVYKIGTATNFPTNEIIAQIDATRARPGVTGNVHFSMNHFMSNRGGVNEALLAGPYAEPALAPASPWLAAQPPVAPVLAKRVVNGETEIRFRDRGARAPRFRVISWKTDDNNDWRTEIIAGKIKAYRLAGAPAQVSVVSVDKTGQESKPAMLKQGQR
ncbi:MAG: glycoside hydrolase family 10 protein [Blastocatellia bacterium]